MTTCRAALALIVVTLTGCATGFGELHPTPNVLLKPSSQSIAISVGNGVLENGEPGGSYPLTTNITRWHETLANGFHTSFDRFFAPPSTSPDLTLVVMKAEPSFVPVVRAYRGVIAYQAELVDRSGKVVDTFAGTAVANQEWMVGYNSPADVLSDAVGNLYERIAQQMPRDL